MSELSFLIELLLNHKLPKKTKDAVKDRIKEIEQQPVHRTHLTQPQVPRGTMPLQAPSMQARIEAMEAEKRGEMPIPSPIEAQGSPTTMAAAHALQDRQNLIQNAINANTFGGKPEPGRSGPRKF